MFVKKGDKVRVIAGKDKGTEAVVIRRLLSLAQSYSSAYGAVSFG